MKTEEIRDNKIKIIDHTSRLRKRVKAITKLDFLGFFDM